MKVKGHCKKLTNNCTIYPYIVGVYICVCQYKQWDIVEAIELEYLIHWLGSNVEREL